MIPRAMLTPGLAPLALLYTADEATKHVVEKVMGMTSCTVNGDGRNDLVLTRWTQKYRVERIMFMLGIRRCIVEIAMELGLSESVPTLEPCARQHISGRDECDRGDSPRSSSTSAAG